VSVAVVRRYRDLSLRSRIIIVFTSLALFATTLISILGYREFSDFLKSEELQRVLLIREQKVHEIGSYIRDLTDKTDALANNPNTFKAFSLYRKSASFPVFDAALQTEEVSSTFYFFRYLQSRRNYHDIFLISKSGDIFFTVAREADLGTNLITGRYRDTALGRAFRRSRMLLQGTVSEASFYPPSNEPAMFLVEPVIREGHLEGAIAVQVDNESLYEKITDLTGLKATGETVIGIQDAVGGMVTVIAPLRHRPDAAFKMKIHAGSSLGIPLQEASSGLTGNGEVIDYRGEPILAAWTYLPELKAGMVIKIDASEAFEPLSLMWKTVFTIALLILLLAVGSGILLAGTIANPVTKLTDLIEQYAAGDLSVRSGHDSKDELGRLAASFNAMADRIEEYHRLVREQNDQLERRVEERTATLSAANEEIRSFAYIVSHDLRAPLVNIRGFSSELSLCVTDVSRIATLVRSRLQQGDQETLDRLVEHEIPEAMEFISSSVSKMDRMLSAILKLSRFGHRQLQIEEIDMQELVSGIVDSLAYQLEAGRTEIISKDLPVIFNDRLVMEQIMGNMMDNAVKYLSPERPGRIEVTAVEIGAGMTFSVQDNGIGISDSDRDKVFQIFRRGAHAGVEGEGMGLAYVQTLVRAQGGNISYESVIAEGSCFSVFLPSGKAAVVA